MNIAEILKNCPEGTKLYSPVWGNVELIKVNVLNNIEIKDINEIKYIIYPDGKYSENGEVILFPSKEQYNWDEFLIPFKNGDIIVTTDMTDVYPYENVAIFKEYREKNFRNKMIIHCQFDANGNFFPKEMDVIHKNWRLANAEEVQHFITRMHESGYDFKDGRLITLPNFRTGDTITNGTYSFKISRIDDIYYYEEMGTTVNRLLIQEQHEWKLKKFDVRSLKPYDKVLAKSGDGCWYPTLVSYVEGSEVYLIDTTDRADYVIPFEGNEHLIGKFDDPDPYYITWT